MSLTTRQQQILSLVAQGLRDREIADQLCLSAKTVETYLVFIYADLGARNRAHAVDIGWRRGLLGPVLVGQP